MIVPGATECAARDLARIESGEMGPLELTLLDGTIIALAAKYNGFLMRQMSRAEWHDAQVPSPARRRS